MYWVILKKIKFHRYSPDSGSVVSNLGFLVLFPMERVTLRVEAPVFWTSAVPEKPNFKLMNSLILPRTSKIAPKASLVDWGTSKIPKPKRTAVPENKSKNLGKKWLKNKSIQANLPATRIIAIPKAISFFRSWFWIHGKSWVGHHPAYGVRS